MENLKDKKILLIICGGIAAYKSLETIRILKKKGAEIKTILTVSAKEFITPLSIASLSQGKVYDDMFSVENESKMSHIALSRWADLILVQPATANTISKITRGTSEDLASTVILASNKPIFLVPAMNVRMWEHPSTKENLEILKSYSYKIIGPEIGEMACGEFGEGKMTEPIEIVKKIENYLLIISKNKKLKALVTAGPTIERIDPVRFISNRSSGKQGYEIAKSLSRNGYQTILISGPSSLKVDDEIKLIKVETTEQMFRETQKNLPVDVAIFSAAVADFKVSLKSQEKIKKRDELTLKLERNIDILNYVSNHNLMRPKLVIGFAAETNNLEKNALEKLKNKNCDMIIANDVSNQKIGFNSDFNEVTILYRDSKKEKLAFKNKSLISDEIVERVTSQLN